MPLGAPGLFVFDQRVPLQFHFSQLSVTSLAQKQHTCLQKLFLTSKTLARTDFVEQKQIKSTTAAYSKLRTLGAKTCHFCTQLEHVFSSRVHALTLRCNRHYKGPPSSKVRHHKNEKQYAENIVKGSRKLK